MKIENKTPGIMIGTLSAITATLAGCKVELGWDLPWIFVFLPMMVFVGFLSLIGVAFLIASWITKYQIRREAAKLIKSKKA